MLDVLFKIYCDLVFSSQLHHVPYKSPSLILPVKRVTWKPGSTTRRVLIWKLLYSCNLSFVSKTIRWTVPQVAEEFGQSRCLLCRMSLGSLQSLNRLVLVLQTFYDAWRFCAEWWEALLRWWRLVSLVRKPKNPSKAMPSTLSLHVRWRHCIGAVMLLVSLPMSQPRVAHAALYTPPCLHFIHVFFVLKVLSTKCACCHDLSTTCTMYNHRTIQSV